MGPFPTEIGFTKIYFFLELNTCLSVSKFEVSANSEFYRLCLGSFENGSQFGIFQVRNYGKWLSCHN